ncbi:MAG: leucyl/phenylalanyl-tRNA--protein transferase [Azoarcus sp.]|jgi:leucyl/phenylalanyl-tRNA--protein transferase|nr:leucyl/phenylalanyl-tRNA--protein transferase [Azoarcus sp.]
MAPRAIPWLDDPADFPPASSALDDPSGLVAAGGKLSPEWLLAAYRRGIFPWFNEGDPILWWSPDPRLVLFPREIRLHRSLRRVLRQRRFEVRIDTAFPAVVAACAAPRKSGDGTWIVPAMQAAYGKMHELGHAHSVECWREGRLAGGLYGLALGRVFFGESMFSLETNASKIALVHLARLLEVKGFAMIDCQMTTSHLLSLGAREISRTDFCAGLERWASTNETPECWLGEQIQSIAWNASSTRGSHAP